MKKLNSLLFMICFVSVAIAQVSKSINVPVAGTLTTLLTPQEKQTVTDLTVTGNIDARDVKCMRDEMTQLAVLDISSVSIKAFSGFGGTYDTWNQSYPANEMPIFSFWVSYTGQSKTTLKTLVLPRSATSIGGDAFRECINLTSITFPVELKGYYPVEGCASLINFIVPESNRYLASLNGVLYNKDITTLIQYPSGIDGAYLFPNTVTKIGERAFSGCDKFKGVLKLPVGLKKIENEAFKGTNISSVIFPSGVDSIGDRAFTYCGNLKTVMTTDTTPPILGWWCFQDSVHVPIEKIYVPTNSVSAYKAAPGWSEFKNIVEHGISTSLTSIDSLIEYINGDSIQAISFKVGGGMLKNDLVITAPTNFEISSESGTNFTPSNVIRVSPVDGIIADTTFFVRLKDGLTKNTYSGKITLETEGFTTKYISLNGEVRLINDTTINIVTAGTLSNLLSSNKKKAITKLTITGNINAKDFKCMRDEMPLLSKLNLKDARIVAYSGNGGTSPVPSITYPANEIPDNSFWNQMSSTSKTTLTSISLPTSMTSIGYTAFNGCTGIKTIKCLINTPPNIKANAFLDVLPIVVYVPIGKIPTYKAASSWSSFNIQEYKLTTTTQNVTAIKLTSAKLNGSIDLITESPVKAHGFCWNTTGSPTISDNKIDNGTKTVEGYFYNIITGLSQSTTYYVRAFATDGDSTVYGSQVSFTTASLPSDAGSITGSTTVCQGQSLVTYLVVPITNATLYSWTLPNGVSGTSKTNSITVSFSKSFMSDTIFVQGKNPFGDGKRSFLVVTSNVLPSDAQTITGRTSICQGETQVSYTIPSIPNANTYLWSLPTGASGSSSSNTITVNYSASATSGNITVKGHNDCGDGNAASIAITVNPLPIISTAIKSTTCGSPVSLSPVINYTGSGNLRYKWTPSTGLDNDTISNPTATVINNTTYTVSVTSPSGCSSSASVPVNIIAMSKPDIGIISLNSNNKYRLAWNKIASKGIASYSIYKETTVTNVFEKIGSVPYDSLSVFVDNQSLPDVKSNKYRLSIVDKSGLETEQSLAHKTMHLTINKGLNSTWNLIWESYEGFTVSTYNIYRGTSASNLSFIDAVSGSSTQYSDLDVPSGAVYYQLEVISPTLVSPSKVVDMQKIKNAENMTQISYNSSRSNIATNVISSMNELGENKKINIYPNPVKNEFRIDFEGGSTFEILNLMGQVVYNGNLEKNTIVQTANLSSGVYLIKFKTGKTFEYTKIIKE